MKILSTYTRLISSVCLQLFCTLLQSKVNNYWYTVRISPFNWATYINKSHSIHSFKLQEIVSSLLDMLQNENLVPESLSTMSEKFELNSISGRGSPKSTIIFSRIFVEFEIFGPIQQPVILIKSSMYCHKAGGKR